MNKNIAFSIKILVPIMLLCYTLMFAIVFYSILMSGEYVIVESNPIILSVELFMFCPFLGLIGLYSIYNIIIEDKMRLSDKKWPYKKLGS